MEEENRTNLISKFKIESKTIFKKFRKCLGCDKFVDRNHLPEIENTHERVFSEETTSDGFYFRGAVERGTAKNLKLKSTISWKNRNHK